MTNYFLLLKFINIQKLYCNVLRFYKLDILLVIIVKVS